MLCHSKARALACTQSSMRMWRRYLGRLPMAVVYLQRCLSAPRVTLSASNVPLTRTFLGYGCTQIPPVTASEVIGCAAAPSTAKYQRKSNVRGCYYHHNRYHSRSGRQSRADGASFRSSSFSVIPMLGVGVVLCKSSSKGEETCKLIARIVY